MNDNNRTFRLLKQNSIIIFAGVLIIALVNQTACSKKPQTVHSDYILTTAEEVVVHEAAHYILYKASMLQNGCEPKPLEIVLDANGITGHFANGGHCNKTTQIVTNYAGYAAVTVFYNLDPKKVFQKVRTQPDFEQAKKIIGEDEALQYKNFLIAIEWVKAYRNSILNFSQRLKTEKTIKWN